MGVLGLSAFRGSSTSLPDAAGPYGYRYATMLLQDKSACLSVQARGNELRDKTYSRPTSGELSSDE